MSGRSVCHADGLDLVEALRVQAAACAEMGSGMYAELLTRAADDVVAGGVVGDLLSGFTEDPDDAAVGLRLLGSVHRLVLERRAGALAAFYPSVGGTFEPVGAWREIVRLFEEQPEAVSEWLDRPPQTNEAGRAAALYGGLLHLPALEDPRGLGELPVRLFELGASAGLNLRADHFCYLDAGGRRFGAETGPLVVVDAWRGRELTEWPGLRIVERLGCDVRPVDPSTPEGRLLLTAYVWPDQRARLDRLRAAMEVARELPARVRREEARSFVRGLDLADGATTVVWHSVMWQYLSAAEQVDVAGRLEELGAAATARRPFVHLRCEPVVREDRRHEFAVHLRVWPGGEERMLGTTVGHGVPTTWS